MPRVAASGRVLIPTTANIIFPSDNFADGTVTKNAVTIVGGVTDPFGGTGAYNMSETAALNLHGLIPGSGIALKPTLTWISQSVFYRPGSGGGNFAGLRYDFGIGQYTVIWNLTTRAITLNSYTPASGGAYSEQPIQWVEPFPNSWFRYTIAIRFRSLPTGFFSSFPIMSSDGTTLFYAGNVARNVDVFRTQCAFSANYVGQSVQTVGAPINNAIRNKALGRVPVGGRITP